ncbi:MAG: hypothetical protein HYZ73_01795 [Elusimicrobia bacterium]|nr:hypothetical protein [Elusimicrobiota bacterium]
MLTELVVTKILKEIQADIHSGATEIARQGARCLTVFSEDCIATTPQEYWEKLLEVGRTLIQCQPSMASLFNLVNTVLLAVKPLKDTPAEVAVLRQTTRETAERFTTVSLAALDRIARHGQGLISSGAVVLTHSASSSIAGILKLAKREGKDLQAIVTESRPLCEGRELARNLGQAGIPTTVIMDAAIPQYVKTADVALVGVDRLSQVSFVNKVGTLVVALAAQTYQVPFYIACELNKCLPSDSSQYLPTESGAEERVQEEWENVQLAYSYFEEIPTTYVTGIITEEGILSVNALGKRVRAFRLCEELQAPTKGSEREEPHHANRTPE